ncbi:unnamed protein product [Chrysodeixis includens]|uniref:Gustatory receptor n=1 Tax=Chrysodeixis includens TaxID=689277 RepID=A0A9P0BUN1_CHRIL|nr:unnamed protein product [Chrysodeixis includens]
MTTHYGPDIWGLLMLFVYVIRPVLFLTVPCLALDLTADNIKMIKILCIEKRVLCGNERQRNELNNLLVYLEHCPLRYTVWRAFPLGSYLLLSCFSFCVVNVIAVLQIKGYYA